ncbi:hypothetical protein LMG19087_04911 [Ralstonia wenshanensis]|uniref:hypothetical protein n=1 Tax=Ralstonia wenshanensis TaxID=2842456 RepID=UPI0028F4D6EC|nr:hypothetical protein [Ralstonia wenshanensis]CAJ0822628.1 hypothetical protein LMG19087_04911 [Ralstonia wenshanensis]
MPQVTLDEQRVQIVAAAEKGNTLVVPSAVEIGAAAYTVSLDFQAFVNLLAHSKPTAIYLLAVKFDPQEDLESWWDIDEGDEDDQALMRDAKVKQFIRKMGHAGEIGSLMASFIVDGVLHTLYADAEWYAELAKQAEELKSQVYVARERKEDDEDKKMMALVREHAKILSEHPKFTEGRPSKEKRTYLAESLFPGLETYLIYRVVDEASNMVWLANGK